MYVDSVTHILNLRIRNSMWFVQSIFTTSYDEVFFCINQESITFVYVWYHLRTASVLNDDCRPLALFKSVVNASQVKKMSDISKREIVFLVI